MGLEEKIRFNARGMELSGSLTDYFLEKFSKVEHQDLIEWVDVEFAQTKSHRGADKDFYIRVLIKLPKVYIRVKKFGNEIYAIVDEITDVLVKKMQQYFEELTKKPKVREVLIIRDNLSREDSSGSESQKYLNYQVKVRRKDLNEMVPISVQEAVQHLELLELPAYLFRNVDEDNQIQMIYKDGDEYVLVVPPKV